MVVKPAFPLRGMEPIFGAGLAKAEKQRIIDQIRARPYEYVAQEQVALSTAPVWDHGHLYPRSLVLRTYVLNTGSGWIAMPGGLVRVAEADGQVVSMQRGGRSKDAWVLSDGPVDTFSMLRPRNQPVQLQHAPRGPAQPRRGQPFLAGPLRRTVGIHRPPAALPDDARPAGQSTPNSPACFGCTVVSIPRTALCPKIAPPLRAIWKTNSSR